MKFKLFKWLYINLFGEEEWKEWGEWVLKHRAKKSMAKYFDDVCEALDKGFTSLTQNPNE